MEWRRSFVPTTVTLDEPLAARIAGLAAGQPVEAFVADLLQGLVDANIDICDGLPVFRMPPEAPVLTSAEVARLLHTDLES